MSRGANNNPHRSLSNRHATEATTSDGNFAQCFMLAFFSFFERVNSVLLSQYALWCVVDRIRPVVMYGMHAEDGVEKPQWSSGLPDGVEEHAPVGGNRAIFLSRDRSREVPDIPDMRDEYPEDTNGELHTGD
jgi:hypothetical protein